MHTHAFFTERIKNVFGRAKVFRIARFSEVQTLKCKEQNLCIQRWCLSGAATGKPLVIFIGLLIIKKSSVLQWKIITLFQTSPRYTTMPLLMLTFLSQEENNAHAGKQDLFTI